MNQDPFPTLERARATLRVRSAPAWQFWNRTNLLKGEPESAEKLAALWLDARLLIRTTRRSEEHIGPATLAELPRTEGEPTDGGRSQFIARVIDALPKPCSFCSMSPGHNMCSGCGGEGMISVVRTDGQGRSRTELVRCTGCGASGVIQCGRCDGTATSQRVEIEWVEDDWKTLRYVYLPQMTFALESELREYVESVDEWPEALAMPLEEKLVSGPYRNAPAAAEEFCGYLVDGPIDEARAMIERISGAGRVLRANVQAFVVPLLFLRYPGALVAVHHQIEGGMGVLVAR